MKAVGIIAEYNPFHNGHLFHLNAAKRMSRRDYVVVVMSGNYVQRGEPAVYDKRLRTRAALLNGADAVFELPSYYSTSAADYFARGAVKLLSAAGVVDCLCFGSELGDIAPLDAAANVLLTEPDGYRRVLKQTLACGLSFAAARGAALAAEFESRGLTAPDGLFTAPNNTLATEYIKAIKLLHSSITPVTVKRTDSENTVSASVIRAMLLDGRAGDAARFTPPEGRCDSGEAPRSLDGYSQYFKTFLYKARDLFKINLLGETESCLAVPDMDEGLLVRFLRETARRDTVSAILGAVKTKRYTYTRLQRAVLHIVLGITSGDVAALENHGGPPYLRLLGFRKQSEPLIREIAANAALPVVIDTATARKNLPPFALTVFEREARDELSVPVMKI